MATCRQATYFAGMGAISREKYEGEEADRNKQLTHLHWAKVIYNSVATVFFRIRLDIVSSNWACGRFYTIEFLSLNHDF